MCSLLVEFFCSGFIGYSTDLLCLLGLVSVVLILPTLLRCIDYFASFPQCHHLGYQTIRLPLLLSTYKHIFYEQTTKQACGVCHSDCFCVLGARGAIFPAIPGHEVIGKVRKPH